MNEYASASRWTRFQNRHTARRRIVGAYLVMYIIILLLFIFAQSMGAPFTNGILGLILMFLIFCGGHVIFTVLMAMFFMGAYRKWLNEIGRILGLKGPLKGRGRIGFYSFVFMKSPVGFLADLKDDHGKLVEHELEAELAERRVRDTEAQAEVLKLQRELLRLGNDCAPDSPELKRILKAANSNGNAQSLRSIIADIEAKRAPVATRPKATPAAAVVDKIAELEATFLAEAAAGKDEEAGRLFEESKSTKDRKERRRCLTKAISLQRTENARREKLREKARHARSSATA